MQHSPDSSVVWIVPCGWFDVHYITLWFQNNTLWFQYTVLHCAFLEFPYMV